MEKELQGRYPDLSVCRSEVYFLEVMPGGTSKAEGVRSVIEREGIRREDLICCGDAENDISMIRYAGVGVAMGNARDSVKAAADHVAGSNEEDALVDVIRRFIRN